MLADAFLSLVRKATRDLDLDEIRAEVAALAARSPDLTTRQRADRMVRRAARRAAALGALASLPPGWAAVAAVAPELSALIILQSRLIVGLHVLYGGTPEPDERALEVLAGVAAGAGINVGRRLTARAAEEVAARIAVRIAGREATRFVPLAGVAASAALNYAAVRAVGRAALARVIRLYGPPEISGPSPVVDVKGEVA
ncbi:MAG TPA: hypothetical protein VL084_13725 [Thermoanaerobaculia bacterium]|nr:hypothetical protein [Thermoanaerobaculia bacterium]